MRQIFFSLALLFLSATPLFAQTTPTTFAGLVNFFIGFINLLIPFVFALTFLVLVWYLIKNWVLHSGEDSAVEEGKKYLLAGIIAFVVMISMWGLVSLLRSSVF